MSASSRVAVGLWLMAAGAFAQNLYPNPDFDNVDGTTGWQAGPGSVRHKSDDASGCPASGSLVAEAEKLGPLNYQLQALGPCLAFDEATSVDASFLYRGISCPTCFPVDTSHRRISMSLSGPLTE